MKTEIDKYERIQEYLRGNMSDEDRVAFERDLATDDTLRQQCEDLSLLARSIKKANQEVDLRKALAETEQQIAEAPDASLNNPALKADLDQVERELRMMGIPVDEPKRSSVQGIREWIARFLNALALWFIPSGNVSAQSSEGNTVVFPLSYASRMAISLAVAASLAIAIILPYNHSVGMSGFNYAPSYIDLSSFRGSSSDMLEKAINSYNNGDYGQAFSYLEEAKKGIESTLAQLGDDDSDVIAQQGLNDTLYQIEWYRALVLMKDKKVKKARRALRTISESYSPFAKDALDILDNVY